MKLPRQCDEFDPVHARFPQATSTCSPLTSGIPREMLMRCSQSSVFEHYIRTWLRFCLTRENSHTLNASHDPQDEGPPIGTPLEAAQSIYM